jgi:hypothetical protein
MNIQMHEFHGIDICDICNVNTLKKNHIKGISS